MKKLITPTSIALDQAAELVQEQIDLLHFNYSEHSEEGIYMFSMLRKLKKDIIDRKPVREPVRSTDYTQDMDLDDLSTTYEKGMGIAALDNLTPEEEEKRAKQAQEWLERITENEWRASPDRSGGQFTDQEIKEDLERS